MEDYPKTLAEFEKRFSTEEACREYLFQLRWPNGFVCPACGGSKMWTLRNSFLYRCGDCREETAVTRGTVFHGSHMPLTTWFRVMWHICIQKHGASALGLQRVLGLGSYRTAWLCLHKLRRAMIRPGRDRLKGIVELDETVLGGEKAGKRGRGAAGKSLVLIAAECDGSGIGRIRLTYLPKDGALDGIKEAVLKSIEPGARIVSDKWSQYVWLKKAGYEHEAVRATLMLNTSGKDPLPRCHRVASLLKRWIMGTLQGSLQKEHLQEYLNEFAFRFNRRKSASRGKLFYRLAQQSVQIAGSTYSEIIKTP